MPLVIGGAAIAFIFLALLTLVTLYWLLTKAHDFSQSLVFPLDKLADVFGYLRDRNLELIRDVVNIFRAVMGWAIDRINEGFQILLNLWNAGPTAQLIRTIQEVGVLQGVVNTVINPAIANLDNGIQALQTTVNGFLTLNVNALNAWRAQTTALLQNVIAPQLQNLLTSMTLISTIAIPQLRGYIDAVNQLLTSTITTVIKPLQQKVTDFQDSTTIALRAPGTGIIPRVGNLEGEMGRVLPWATAIGITGAVALNLARLGKNPCWCTSEGPLQDNGTLELATLMDLL